jgi:hypothetical protein
VDPSGRGQQPNPSQTAQGLEYAFLLFLIPLVVAGILMFVALRTYPTDVASAAASEEATREAGQQPQAA